MKYETDQTGSVQRVHAKFMEGEELNIMKRVILLTLLVFGIDSMEGNADTTIRLLSCTLVTLLGLSGWHMHNEESCEFHSNSLLLCR